MEGEENTGEEEKRRERGLCRERDWHCSRFRGRESLQPALECRNGVEFLLFFRSTTLATRSQPLPFCLLYLYLLSLFISLYPPFHSNLVCLIPYSPSFSSMFLSFLSSLSFPLFAFLLTIHFQTTCSLCLSILAPPGERCLHLYRLQRAQAGSVYSLYNNNTITHWRKNGARGRGGPETWSPLTLPCTPHRVTITLSERDKVTCYTDTGTVHLVSNESE